MDTSGFFFFFFFRQNFVKAFESCLTNKTSFKFWKETIMKSVKKNNDNDIGTFAMLTYGRNAKMTFCVFMSQERHKPFLGMFIFIIGVSPSNFVVVSFLLTSLRKGYFSRQWIRRYRFLKAGTAVLLVLNILLPASTRISMRNRFLYDGWMDG